MLPRMVEIITGSASHPRRTISTPTSQPCLAIISRQPTTTSTSNNRESLLAIIFFPSPSRRLATIVITYFITTIVENHMMNINQWDRPITGAQARSEAQSQLEPWALAKFMGLAWAIHLRCTCNSLRRWVRGKAWDVQAPRDYQHGIHDPYRNIFGNMMMS